MSVVTDLQQRAFTTALPTTNETGAEWDEAEWNVASWSNPSEAINQWQGISNYGSAVSVRIEAETNAEEFRFFSADLISEKAVGI